MKYQFSIIKNSFQISSIRQTQDANFKFQILLVVLFVYLLTCLPAGKVGLLLPKANATSSSNSNYDLEIQDIDTAPEKKPVLPKNTNENSDTINAESQEQTPGIQSISQTGPIQFVLSTDTVDFGALSPGNPVIRSMVLSTISSSTDYQIIGSVDNPLKGPELIPDTTCDDGTCTEESAAVWKNDLTYGFGYSCLSLSSMLCMSAQGDDFFMQFADISKNEKEQSIIEGWKNPKEQQAQISLKLNVSGTQKTGYYSNTLTLIAAPKY